MIVRILRVLLALIFLIFGGMKMFDAHAFVENVANFQIAPFAAQANLHPGVQDLS